MANKQSFTPEEWNEIVESVVLSGMAVTAADPSGLIGLLQESFASGSALLKAKSDPGAGELVKSVVAEFETSEGRGRVQQAIKTRLTGAKAGDVSQRSIDALREASRILDMKAPQESAAFKQWLHNISENVAAAASEGGILGFGGQRVSDAEKATLREIDKALGMAA